MTIQSNDMYKRIIKNIEKNEESFNKFNKQITFFNQENKIGFSKSQIDLSDLSKIDIDFILEMIPKVVQGESRQRIFEKSVEKIKPTVQNNIDFI